MTKNEPGSGASWDFLDPAAYARRVSTGFPPVIVTCAITGDHHRADHPRLPVTAAAQAAAARDVFAAGARIVHIHGRDGLDPDRTAADPQTYLAINELIREAAPEILIDNTQTVTEAPWQIEEVLGTIYYYRSAPLRARPDLMSLNPGPMAFRGGPDRPSSVIITTFDENERVANAMRDAGIKPQVFLYHPGHLDLLDHLIAREALDPPYFVQLVFGQQSGINPGPDSVLYMLRNLPGDCLFQTCALGLHAIQVNTLALLLGGHVRTGMEDALLYQREEPVRDNTQLVARVISIGEHLGRRVATPEEVRTMIGVKGASG
ncbi:MAG: 3-keto-5-aminohexanoate cleavage protein [Thermomicrobiales bacterium]